MTDKVFVSLENLQRFGARIKAGFIDVSTNQSVDGTKDFNDSPLVPDLALTDESEKSANTAYVHAAVNTISAFDEDDMAAWLDSLIPEIDLITASATGSITYLTRTLQNSVTRIRDCAFMDNTGLTGSLSFPNVISVGKLAFGNTNVESISFGSALTSIGEGAFSNSTIRTITINKAEGSVSGAPWGALGATVNWVG